MPLIGIVMKMSVLCEFRPHPCLALDDRHLSDFRSLTHSASGIPTAGLAATYCFLAWSGI